MAYSDKVLDHYENPRNVGSFDRRTRTSAPHGRRAGLRDVMKLADPGQRAGRHRGRALQDLRLRFGIASSSLVTEWVKGKTLAQAETIRNTQIAEELALPPVKIHCSILAEDAIKAAIVDYRKKHGLEQPAEKEAKAA